MSFLSQDLTAPDSPSRPAVLLLLPLVTASSRMERGREQKSTQDAARSPEPGAWSLEPGDESSLTHPRIRAAACPLVSEKETLVASRLWVLGRFVTQHSCSSC